MSIRATHSRSLTPTEIRFVMDLHDDTFAITQQLPINISALMSPILLRRRTYLKRRCRSSTACISRLRAIQLLAAILIYMGLRKLSTATKSRCMSREPSNWQKRLIFLIHTSPSRGGIQKSVLQVTHNLLLPTSTSPTLYDLLDSHIVTPTSLSQPCSWLS
jgi:hypothetical protein